MNSKVAYIIKQVDNHYNSSSEWMEYKLNEIYDFGSGLSKPRGEFGFGYGFLSFKEIFNNYFVPDTLIELVNSTEKEQKSCSIQRGDVFLTRTSETDEDLGMSCVALKDYPKATFNGFTKRLRPNGKIEVLPEYAAFFFRNPKFRANISGISSITTRASLNNDMLSSLAMLVPSMNIQIKISETLKTIHDKIDLLHRQNQTLEKMAETLFRQWFVEEAKEDWENCLIEDLCSQINSGGTPPTKIETYYNGNINWYSTKELNDNFLFESNSKITKDGLNNSSAKLFPSGTVLIAIYASPTVGRLGILGNEAAFNQAACGLIANDKICCKEFIYLYLKNQRNELNVMASGSAQQNLNVGKIKSYPAFIPDNYSMSQFKKDVIPLFEKIENNTIQIRTLTALRDTLLPRLMSGEIRCFNDAQPGIPKK